MKSATVANTKVVARYLARQTRCLSNFDRFRDKSKYYFNPEGTVSPFIGAGLNYTWTFDEEGKGALDGEDVDVDNSFGFAGQLGLRFALANDWDIVADLRYIDLNADVELNGVNIGEADVDPMVYSILIGKRF